MSNKLLKACSVLPVFAVCGMISTVSLTSANAAVVDIEEGQLFENQKNKVADERAGALTISYGDSLSSDGVSNVTFKNNSSVNSGGAMKALNGFSAGDGWTFEGNTSDKISGGLYVKIPEAENSNRNVSFGNNTTFKGNSSKWLGGALGIEAAENFVMGDGALFEENSTDADGGAIAIWTDKSNGVTVGSNLTLGQSVFKGNTAANRGGAIANLNNDEAENKTDFYNTVTVGANSVFEGNSAKTGGAIYNLGDMTVSGSFINNTASLDGGAIVNDVNATLTVNEATFVGNRSTGYGYGGAIGSKGQISITDSSFINNRTEFVGGALYSGYNDNGTGKGAAVISGTLFSGNEAVYGAGAIANYANMEINISQSIFDGNKVTGALVDDGYDNHNLQTSIDGGGALFVGSASTTNVENAVFTNNSSTVTGGAISTRADWYSASTDKTINDKGNAPEDYDTSTDYLKPNTKAELNLKSVEFSGNTAGTYGGAVYNTFEKTSIADSVFTGNTADVSGGAIYNESVAKIALSGDNVFTGNTAAGVANDIHNDGVIGITAGTTTIGSGITGAGSLNIADGAIMNIGTTTVEQTSINIDGTLIASMLNADNYGKLLADEITTGENGKLQLAIGNVGTYDIFGDVAHDDITIDAGAAYVVTNNGADGVVIETKSVDKIAQDTGLSTNSANVVNVLANVDNEVFNTISLYAQQDIIAGNVERVEAETAKLNPDDKPVAQSVATSVQNQVLSLAAGRMSGASVGRSGGDLADADYGVWVQGLYNHSKYNGKFKGDTTGISAGFDTLIDGKYTLGIGYAYNDTDVDSDSRDTKIESNSVFVYGQYKPAEWYVNAALNYTMANYTETADPYGILHESEYDVNSFGGQVMAGYDFAFGLTPEAGVRYLNVSQDAYESLLGHVDGVDTNYLTGVAGVKYAFEIESDYDLKFRPEVRAAATYDFLSDSAVATITAPGNLSYVIDADRLSRLGGEFGIGLTAQYRGLEVSLNYDLDLHEDYTSQTGMLKFRYNF